MNILHALFISISIKIMAISQVVCQAQTPTPNKLLSYGETEAINGENTLLPPSMLSWTCYTRGKYLHYLWDMEWKTGKGIQRSFSFLSILHLLHCIHNWGGGGVNNTTSWICMLSGEGWRMHITYMPYSPLLWTYC